jgi:CRISPR type I-E-associated protein CasB/Cse2
MSNSQALAQAKRFVEWLLENREDSGVMANLRRGFSEATEHYVWPHLARFCSLEDEKERMIFATIAACFAFHPEHTEEGNFGTTLRQIALARQAGDDPLQAFEGRFRRIVMATTVQDLCQQLRSLVQLAKASGIKINYVQLLSDLLSWDQNARQIKVQWAEAYYAPYREEPEETLSEEISSQLAVSETPA